MNPPQFVCVHFKDPLHEMIHQGQTYRHSLINREEIAQVEVNKDGDTILTVKGGTTFILTDSMQDITKQIFGTISFLDRLKYLVGL